MRSSRVLGGCVLGLVLANLVFVQLTEAARLQWLLPLYALTLLSPILRPLREKLVYRGLWNAAVLGVFTLLMRHASGDDLRYVLEDGLVLAALCQVHLLNNLRTGQRSDLLFLNAFLIAVATGFLTQDLAYAAAFAAFAPLFVIGLSIRGATDDLDALPPAATVRIVRDGLLRSGVLLAFSLLAFLFWPRDFHRQGLLADQFDFAPRGDTAEVGFDDTLKLEGRNKVGVSDRVALRVSLLRGEPGDVPALWRGATLASTNGNVWWALEGGGTDEAWTLDGVELRRLGVAGSRSPKTTVAVEDVDPDADRVFAPHSAVRLTPGRGLDPHRLEALPDGTLRYTGRGRTLGYALALAESAVSRGLAGAIPDEPSAELRPYTVLPRSPRLAAAVELAERLAAGLPGGGRGAEQHELVERFRAELSTRFAYLPPGAEGAAVSLPEFMAGKRGGHCEFFASALAAMLRSRGVPARVVTGYRGDDWDADARTLTLRRRDAHAWVEAFDPTAGWYAVDPSPAPALDRELPLWARARNALSVGWSRLLAFDPERRAAVFAWLRELPARAAARTTPGGAGVLALIAVAAGLWFQRVRRRRVPAELRRYRSAVAAAGLTPAPGETPRELLARADTLLPPPRFESLRAATHTHERARYAGGRPEPVGHAGR